jgi:hypothetical protein
MGPTDRYMPMGPAPRQPRDAGDYRSFITQLVCTKPGISRSIGHVHWRSDNGAGEGWFETSDLSQYRIGDVIHINIKVGD